MVKTNTTKLFTSSSSNPLLKSTKFPPFSSITPRHIKPAITIILKHNRQAIKKLLQQKPPFSWNNLLAALEEIEDGLSKVWAIISHLNAVQNTPSWRKIYNEVLPHVSKYHTEMGQNERLYKAILSIKKNREFSKLNSIQQKIIKEMLRDFRLSGVALPPNKKKHFAKIKLDLAKLNTKFANNVLDATYSWQYCISENNQNELSGIPQYALAAARKTAQNKKQSGYLFSLDMPSYQAIITFANSRSLREKFYTAFITRASNQGDQGAKYDNRKIMEKIMHNRNALTKLLNFKTYAEFSLATKMVHQPKKVISFLEKIAKYAKNKAKSELNELAKFAKKYCNIKKLEPWDIAYCSEKLRQHKYQLNEEEIRQYFPAPHVLTGLFNIVQKLFGFEIKEIKNFDSWHNNAQLFAIYMREEENNITNEAEFSRMAQIDPSSLNLGKARSLRAPGMYGVIHEGEVGKGEATLRPTERQNQGDFGCFSHDAGKQQCEKREQEQQHSINSKCEGYIRGYFYVDLYAREHKKGGAWMEECRVRRKLANGNTQIPIAYLNCNFSAPTAKTPSLLSHREVETIFHEFGHCLQHLLSKVDYAPASGINNIPIDAVEFPSQFMENWCWQNETLKILSCHYQTKKPLPQNLINKLQKAKNFQIGLQTLRQLEFGLFDCKLHMATNTGKYAVMQKILNQVRHNVRVTPTAKFDRMINSFEHIFNDGYAAGYYSYKWSEMMAIDAFSEFKKKGVFDKTTGKSYLHNILEVGNSIEPQLAFENFCGHKPKIDALLKEHGL